MKKSVYTISRMLLSFLLCTGVALTSCVDDPLEKEEDTLQNENPGDKNEGDAEGDNENEGGEGSEDEGGENPGDNDGEGGNESENEFTKGILTYRLENVTELSATFTGHLDIPSSDLYFSKVTLYYSDAEAFNVNAAESVSIIQFDADQNFAITLTDLKNGTRYNYCLVAEVKSEKTYSDVKEFTTVSLVAPALNEAAEITEVSAVISGKVVFPSVTADDLEYGFQYCKSEGFSSDVVSRKITDMDQDGSFSMEISSLIPAQTYYYRSYVKMGGTTVYGEVNNFTTDNANLSLYATANCYIVSEPGFYKIKTVKGNSSESVGSVTSAEVLWETFGTDVTPAVGDLVNSVSFEDGYIAFQTADTFKEGNAVIAAKDSDGNILWSWHIWFTDQPQAHVYNNGAGTMMDRNLGATSATPGDVGALGLLYQWGRKDPFLGSSSISSNVIAMSTITWPSAVSSDSSNGTIAYATANPTTFIKCNSDNYDWYYTGSYSTDNTRWTESESSKSIYDPCPSGWRVPDGGDNGVWSKALGSSSYFEYTYDGTNAGMNFSGKFGSDQTIWYPFSGYRSSYGGSLNFVGLGGYCWSASPGSKYAYNLDFSYYGSVDPSDSNARAYGRSVRCLQE